MSTSTNVSTIRKLIFWYQNKFNQKSNSVEIKMLKAVDIKLDQRTNYTGQIENCKDFLNLMLLFILGLENILKFPNLVCVHGGAMFLCLYFIISFVLTVPFYILEIGYGQFYSRSALKCFEIVPFFKGLGWSMIIMRSFYLIVISTIICPSIIYFIYSIFTKMPWTYCGMDLPKINCSLNFRNSSNLPNTLTPNQIFYEIKIMGYRKEDSGMFYNYTDRIGNIRIEFFICMLVTWILTLIFSFIILQLYLKYLRYYIIAIFTILITIMLRTLFLPGSLNGISVLLSPNIDECFTFKSLHKAIVHAIFSSQIGTSTISALSCLNKFHFDFMKIIKVLVTGNFLFSTISAIMVFSVVGHKSYLDGYKMEGTFFYENLTMENYIESVSGFPDARLWTILYSVLILNLGLSTNAICIAGLIITFIDGFPNWFNYSLKRKLIFSTIICFIFCTVSCFYSLKGTFIYIDVIYLQITNLTGPVVVLLESLAVYSIYGHTQFRAEMKMMLGYSYNCFWSLCGIILAPVLIMYNLIYCFYKTKDVNMPFGSKVISYLISFIIFLPVDYCLVKEFYKSIKLNHGMAIINNVFLSPEHIGPYYKKYWFTGKFYQKRLIRMRKNPHFLKSIRETENLGEILLSLHDLLLKLKKNNDKEKVTLRKTPQMLKIKLYE